MDKAVLLIEDRADDAELTALAFAKAKITNPVIWVRYGEEALEYLHGENTYAGRSPLDQPCLVLLDLKLPRLSGLDVLKAIRAGDHTRGVPVLVRTSSGDEAERLGSYMHFANGFLQKPIDARRFLVAIQDLGLYCVVRDHPPMDVIATPA